MRATPTGDRKPSDGIKHPITRREMWLAQLARGVALVSALAATAQAQSTWVATDLGTLGGASNQATAINDAAWVVGRSTTASGETRAFVWTAAGGMVDLGTLGGTYSEANDIVARATRSSRLTQVCWPLAFAVAVEIGDVWDWCRGIWHRKGTEISLRNNADYPDGQRPR